MQDKEVFQPLKPNNPKSLGVLGYLIVLNNQVHSYEMKALENYLERTDTKIEDTCLDAIIRGVEESVSYASSVEAFSSESNEVKLCLLHLMYVLSFVDNHFADSEEQYIGDISKNIGISGQVLDEIKASAEREAMEIRTQNNTIFVRSQTEEKKSIWARIIAWFLKLFNKILGKDTSESKDPENRYKEVIDKCADIAKEDLGIVEPAYSKVLTVGQETIESIRSYKRSLSLETGLSASVAKTVECFADMLNTEVVEQTNRDRVSLEQKKRTISDFTISLIGRTKAGKSTLHAILTQQGKDRIGVGKQRTTRYNWVYQWNLLRIIDTPGVGSAEADGRKDEEIAESVLGESDIICFVVADDSILKDVLEFIEKIALLNKPVIILLNHKENIRPDVKFKRFINDPGHWLTDEGESSLKGHENRIRKYADDRGFGKLVNIYPVFLLPALMSEEEEYSEYRDILWNNSNVESFIKQISSWVLKSGQIKRSQTILDETIKVFEHAKEAISNSEHVVDDQIVYLKKEREVKMAQLRNTLQEVMGNIRTVLEDRMDNLANNEALIFAEEYIGSGTKAGKDVGEKWEAYVERIEFEKNIRSDVDEAVGIYRDKVDRTIKELFEDLYYSVNMSLKINNVDIPIQFDLRTATRITSSVIGLVGAIVLAVFGASNPVGWVLSIVGMVGGLLTMAFTSKEKRRQTAIDKVYKSISDEIKKESPKQIDDLIDQIYTKLSDNTDSIDALFQNLISGLEWTRQMAEKMTNEYSTEIEKINKVYAWRIIQYLESSNDELDYETIDREIVSVDRSDKETIAIETRTSHKVHTEELNTVLAEDISIKRRS